MRSLLRALIAAVLVSIVLPSGPAAAGGAVVGGSAVSTDGHPWVVAIASRDHFGPTRSGQFCGGAVISPTAVLTAAHCFGSEGLRVHWRSASDLRVVVGRTDLNTDDGRELPVRDVWVNPAYDPRSNANDVAIITLAGTLPAGSAVRMAGRSDPENYRPGTVAAVYGWGDTSGKGAYSSVLRAAKVPLLTDERCEEAYPGDAFGAYRREAMVCAGDWAGGKDACQGDSGGPLVAGGKLVGLVSWGAGCALPRQPGVYTRISAVADLVTQRI